ncbi:hypothetical protein P4O66_018648 [Electrophorus voltai]|uniref:Uncharacterized protein n=1 Tax=Electrophorus voltai TaxID=2609070 RepID=A0AAD9DKL9_9TELE|nr:hypothetical protein P4O66_018648 [Electrophorus voltai]
MEAWRGLKAGIRQIYLCEGFINQATYKVNLKENLLPSACLPNSEDCFFPAGQYFTPHSQVNDGVNGGPPAQDPVTASPISRHELD